jgi:hypothetical protein
MNTWFSLFNMFCALVGGYTCIGASNPCKPLLTAGLYYYPHVDESKFVQCDAWGGCYPKQCGSRTVWNQNILACTWP